MARRWNDYKKGLTNKGLRPAERAGESRSIPIANAAAGGRPDYNATGQATKSAEELAARLQRVRNTQRRLNILDAGGGATSLANVTTWPDPDFTALGVVTFANSVNLNSGGWSWNDDGTKLFYPDIGDFDGVHEITCTTPYVPDTQTVGGALEGPQVVVFGQNALFNDDGTKYYQGGLADNSIDSATMSVPYDLSTATDDASNFTVTDCARCSWMAWADNGNGVLIGSGSGNDEIDYFQLTTPYTLTAADLNGAGKSDGTLDLDDGVTVPASEWGAVLGWSTFNEDGTELWCGVSTNHLHIFLLATPYDLTTATWSHRIANINPTQYPTGGVLDVNSGKLLLASQSERFWMWDLTTLQNA